MELCMRIAKQLIIKNIETGFPNKNIVVSPLSLNALLNMLAAGTAGHTREGMLGLLGSRNINEIHSKSKKMMAVAADATGSSSNGEDGPILVMANGAWVDQRFPLKPSYQVVLKGIYNCKAKNVDFATQANKVIDEVNLWATETTRGLIPKLLSRGSLSPRTTAILANGLYFKGTWVDKFHIQCTENRDFYLSNGDIVSVPFMTSQNKYDYGSFNGFKVLKIPYKSGKINRRFSMYFFLPDEQDGLQNLLNKFNSNPGLLRESLMLRKVRLHELWIPKFKFSYGFDVRSHMQDMGLPLPFRERSADFTEMVYIPKNSSFFVSNIFQKALIEIDEKGTEAAAITCCSMETCCAKPVLREYFTFVADHPFMFMIKEESSGLIFFIGTVINPKLES